MNAKPLWMSFRTMIALCFAALMLSVTPGSAQEGQFLTDEKQIGEWLSNIGKPGPEHDRLKLFVGEWTTTVRLWRSLDAEPVEFQGTSTKSMVLGDRYLLEVTSTPEGEGKLFEGIGYTGYDGVTRTFQYVWMNNRTSNMHTETGRYYPDDNLFRFTADTRDPVSGAIFLVTTEIRVVSPDEHILTTHETGPDGVAFRNLEIVFKRK